jgi:hypothetical protein
MSKRRILRKKLVIGNKIITLFSYDRQFWASSVLSLNSTIKARKERVDRLCKSDWRRTNSTFLLGRKRSA